MGWVGWSKPACANGSLLLRRVSEDISGPVRTGKVRLKVQTAALWHSHIEHEASRAVRRIGFEEIENGRKFLDMQANCP
jgi:hypothetical protein